MNEVSHEWNAFIYLLDLVPDVLRKSIKGVSRTFICSLIFQLCQLKLLVLAIFLSNLF